MTDANDVTRRPDDETRPPRSTPAGAPARDPRTGASPSSRTGSFSSPRSRRFEPGTVLGDRYRIVDLIGRGGMGEVYRAEDLTLDQTVALKFLPVAVEQDPGRLAQLQNEVRMARQVSHPNVCRVYDLSEAGGVHFLTMEHVDGEDLASAQKRFGRLPEAKALDLARQICAGVSAAHSRGVLHRDLKPANVMLDADGHARIADFGLASAHDAEADALVGTPAYMAPEQLAGRGASEKSDLFAVGLILYELFTGRRVFEAQSVDELLQQHEFRSFALPSEIVPGLSPQIERTILHCLDADPASRPASALAIAAALPGGDPLAMALAAGETPSPEMVAAAGGDAATVGPVAGVVTVVAVLVGLVSVYALADRFLLIGRAAFPLNPYTLVDRAREFEASLGLGSTVVDRSWGLESSPGGPTPISFWYRLSPRPLVPGRTEAARTRLRDPPMIEPGMTLVETDLAGRLLSFSHVPVPGESGADGATGAHGTAPVNWSRFFAAASLDMDGFSEAVPERTPRFFADSRVAWTGSSTDWPGVALRVEAAAYRGLPVSFQLIGPWSKAGQTAAAANNPAARVMTFVATVIVLPLSLAFGVLIARRNLSRGRGDQKSALRLAWVVFLSSVVAWALRADHVPDVAVELARLFAVVAQSLLVALGAGLLYLAFEPQVRRVWPQMLITWSRLMAGRLRDVMVGRDLLAGAAAGTLMTLVTFAHYLLPGWLGWPEFRPAPTVLLALMGTREVLGVLVGAVPQALQNAVLGIVGLVAARMLVKRVWPAFLLTTLLFAPLAARGQIETGSIPLDLALGSVLVIIPLGMDLRFGLVACSVAFYVHFVTKDLPTTLDAGRPYFELGVFLGLLVVALAVAGWVLSRGGERLLGRWADETSAG